MKPSWDIGITKRANKVQEKLLIKGCRPNLDNPSVILLDHLLIVLITCDEDYIIEGTIYDDYLTCMLNNEHIYIMSNNHAGRSIRVEDLDINDDEL